MPRSNRSLLTQKPCLLAPLIACLMLASFSSAMAQEKAEGSETAWKALFDGKSLKNWKSSRFGGEGEVKVKDGVIIMSQGSDMTGITWTGEELPKLNYEISAMAKRIDGSDFFCGMTFQVKDDPCSLIIGGWGGGVVGISSLNGLDAANNETARYETFTKDEWYQIRLRVSEIGLQAWIDDKQIVSVATKGKKITIRGEVEESLPFGISCYATTAGLKNIKIRKLAEEESKDALTPVDDTRDPLPKKKK